MPLSHPTTLQIVEAVRAFLEGEVMPSAKGRQAFDLRVAVNALKIVERELADGGALDSAERKRLVGLLGHEGGLEDLNEELATAIEKGEVDASSADLVDHLFRTALGKLRIDNPKYSTYRELLDESE